MPLIKSSEVDRIAHSALVLDLGDLRRQAQQILARAQAEADQLLAEARHQSEQQAVAIHEEARRLGFEEGRAAGLCDGQQSGHQAALKTNQESLKQLQANWLAALNRWEQEREQLMSDARQGLLELAVDLGRRIVRRLPDIHPETVVDQVGKSVEYVSDPQRLRIHVNPQDKAILDEALPALVERLPALKQAEWMPDEQVGRGGCVLEHACGRVDATLETQLDRIASGLLGLEEQPEGESL